MLPMSKLIGSLILLGCLRLSTAQPQTQITYITPEQIKNVGEEVQLNCTVQNTQNYAVIWNKKNRDKPQDSSVISVKSALIISDSRFEMNHDVDSSTYSLKIKDIVNSDAGIYECQIVLTSTEKKTNIVELQVRHAPLINEALSTATVLVEVGEPAELKCFADGYPRPTITWKREYDTILPIGGASFTGNVLKLAKVDKRDRGTYLCWADNEVGNPVSKTINLEVEFEPVISVPRPRVAQSLDYEIDLVCQVEAYPAPAISWFRDGKEIHNGDEYRISNFATVEEITTSSVKVFSVKKQNYGDYVCKASNKKGHAEAKLNLYEQSVPNINYAGLQWVSSTTTIYQQFMATMFCVVPLALIILN